MTCALCSPPWSRPSYRLAKSPICWPRVSRHGSVRRLGALSGTRWAYPAVALARRCKDFPATAGCMQSGTGWLGATIGGELSAVCGVRCGAFRGRSSLEPHGPCLDVHRLASRAPRRRRRIDGARGSADPAARSGAGAHGACGPDLGRCGPASHGHGAGAAPEPRRGRHQPGADHQPRLGRGGGPPLRVRAGRRRRVAARAAAGRPDLAALPAPCRRAAGAGDRGHGLAGHGRPRQQLRDQGRGPGAAAPGRAGDRGPGGPAAGLRALLGGRPVGAAADRRRYRRGA